MANIFLFEKCYNKIIKALLAPSLAIPNSLKNKMEWFAKKGSGQVGEIWGHRKSVLQYCYYLWQMWPILSNFFFSLSSKGLTGTGKNWHITLPWNRIVMSEGKVISTKQSGSSGTSGL